jgi:cell division protein YceG involved in septum cleavage
MVFLVGTKSREVLWSIYELPKDTSSKELDRIASAIVSRLKKDMGLVKK